MAGHTFYILDVFAEEKYAGNQLAVFLDAVSIPAETMQRLANETHFSETTFILSDEEKNGGYDVRIFTPEEELPFAGHPTLGTAYVIMHKVMKKPWDEVKLNLGVGQITVTYDKATGALWMKQVEPTFLRTFEPAPLADILGIGAGDIDERFPIQEVSTGIPFIIVPLKSMAAVKRAYLDPRKFTAYMGKKDSTGILVFSPETYHKENALNVRVFTKFISVPEDPATGSGNGCLAAYIVKHKYFGTAKIDIRTEQGYEMGRPSLLFLRAEERGGSIDVRVGGRVIPVAKCALE
ncbi:putative phenazine biosynthesis protein [Methanocella paludicola SANAE]|uniref:Phenazine biosynthesis protein n=1 Tax=Methanocella paludicola (strain DSM 17711 / JCM 13418 / NBRC 101707 / SANAE) TaxID=304371 RepID=D1Z0M0_METPS|nr:PhzF family phenazine biosynthesis isomerase [Methanocella paludicola]BAI62242.1 putative phenazine biosynthesis protein [Methanocella paludicola SANAE]